MIGYVTLGTNDLQRAVGFYDALLSDLGATRHIETEQAFRGRLVREQRVFRS